MTTTLASFRLRLLAALHAARSRWPDSRLYLLYAPGYDDPLGLAKSSEPPKRETALVPWAEGAGYDKPQYPRVVEFDCRRVAAYLLETDPAIDDPLLEDTITLAHRDLSSSSPEPDGEEGTGRSLCGWLVSPDSAHTIARRFASASQRLDPTDSRRYWLRWHDPRMMALLWPGLTAVQKTTLLGDQLTWLAFDAAGHLVEFSSRTDLANHPSPNASSHLGMTKPQWGAAHHLGLVNHLVEAWRDQRDEPLPRDATQAVHRAVVRAEDWGLNGRDLQVFVLTTLALCPGFETDAALRAAVHGAARNPGTLADRIDELPPEFWERYGRDP
jgi:hypothetical protein